MIILQFLETNARYRELGSIVLASAFLIGTLMSCRENEELGANSDYVVLNELGGKANVSIYRSGSKELIEQFYTVTSTGNAQIFGANKLGGNLYISTGTFENMLRKIDLVSGSEIKAVKSWLFSRPIIDFTGTDVVITTAGLDPQTLDKYFYVKRYDESLALQDSIAQPDVFELSASRVVDRKLFYSVAILNQGFFLKVFDLSSKTNLSSISLQKRCLYLIGLGNNELLAIQENGFFTLNTQTLAISKEQTAIFNSNNFSIDKVENQVYFLAANAQPTTIPFSIRRMDLQTGESFAVSQSGQSVGAPILFDGATNRIITGPLRIFSKEGELLDDVALPSHPLHLFVK